MVEEPKCTGSVPCPTHGWEQGAIEPEYAQADARERMAALSAAYLQVALERHEPMVEDGGCVICGSDCSKKTPACHDCDAEDAIYRHVGTPRPVLGALCMAEMIEAGMIEARLWERVG